MNRAELIDGPLTAAVLSGVSARTYARLMCRNLRATGMKRSTVSRKTIAATKPTVDQFLKKRLDDINPVVMLIDGVNVGGRQALACIGIDNSGRKHVIGVRLGTTENQILCRDLLRDMIDRGLGPDGDYLFVIDGSMALAGAIRAAFGQDVHIQRCQEHKIRDVQAYLPFKMRMGVRQKLQAAYSQKTEKAALSQLSRIRSELMIVSEKAANALTEGMFETVTVHRLGVTGLLRKSLRTTNIVESAFASVRRYMGRVGRFQNDSQRDLWLIRSLVEAERHFRNLDGHRQIAELRKKLAKRSAKI
jgi:putative transposase